MAAVLLAASPKQTPNCPVDIDEFCHDVLELGLE